MNLDYYKSKLEDLILQAEKDGYELSNNNFRKTDNDKFPVMEVFFVNNTVYEDYGYFNIYKRTVKFHKKIIMRSLIMQRTIIAKILNLITVMVMML